MDLLDMLGNVVAPGGSDSRCHAQIFTARTRAKDSPEHMRRCEQNVSGLNAGPLAKLQSASKRIANSHPLPFRKSALLQKDGLFSSPQRCPDASARAHLGPQQSAGGPVRVLRCWIVAAVAMGLD